MRRWFLRSSAACLAAFLATQASAEVVNYYYVSGPPLVGASRLEYGTMRFDTDRLPQGQSLSNLTVRWEDEIGGDDRIYDPAWCRGQARGGPADRRRPELGRYLRGDTLGTWAAPGRRADPSFGNERPAISPSVYASKTELNEYRARTGPGPRPACASCASTAAAVLSTCCTRCCGWCSSAGSCPRSSTSPTAAGCTTWRWALPPFRSVRMATAGRLQRSLLVAIGGPHARSPSHPRPPDRGPGRARTRRHADRVRI